MDSWNKILADGKGIVLYDFLLVRGGAERLTLTLMRGLENVDLCVGYRAPKSFPDRELEGINCIDLGAATHIAGWRSIKVMWAFRYRTKVLSGYDWVLYSGTNAPMAVHNHPNGANILYCHTLPRFVYDLREYYLERYPRLLRPALKGLMSYVKPRYEAAVARMDLIIVNSENVRQRMRHYLNRDSIVINPPCDTDKFVWRGQSDYYVSTARLESFKRVEVIIEAFLRMPGKRLVIASGGSEAARLRRLAARADNIQFAGWLDDAALQDLMGHAIATIYIPKDEDFGMSPVESMAAGKPVIGVAEGGLLETVVDGETGTLLKPDPGADNVIEAVQDMTAERALQMRHACERRAGLFSRDRFLGRMREVIYGVRGRDSSFGLQVASHKLRGPGLTPSPGFAPLVTVAIPSFNQGRFLDDALTSVFQQGLPVEVFVADGGSTDETMSVIRRWESRLAGWRSHADAGQSAAINECIARGSAPFVCWLNSDDVWLPNGLGALLKALEDHPEWPAAYGKAWNVSETLARRSRVWIKPFSERQLAVRNMISQPATLVRRAAWEKVGGLDESLYMALDYDLWWRLFRSCGPLGYIETDVALNRDHAATKTRANRRKSYEEARAIVLRHYGRVPVKGWMAWRVSVWLRTTLFSQFP